MTLIVSTHMRKYNIHNNYGGTHIMHTHTHMGLCIHIIYNGGYTHTHRGRHMHRRNHACIDGIMHAQDVTRPGMCSHSKCTGTWYMK